MFFSIPFMFLSLYINEYVGIAHCLFQTFAVTETELLISNGF